MKITFVSLVFLLICFTAGAAEEKVISCSSYPGDQLCWQLQHLISDFEACNKESGHFHRMQKIAFDVKVVPPNFAVADELKKLAKRARNVPGSDCLGSSSKSLEGYAEHLKIKLDFERAMEYLMAFP